MAFRTLKLASIERYLDCEDDSPEERDAAIREREGRLRQFPYAVMLELAYPELDYAHRWLWQHLGPMDGSCTQKYSEYKACADETEHGHNGKWASHWFVKTDYDFGFNEFYFAEKADYEFLIAHLPEIHWGSTIQNSDLGAGQSGARTAKGADPNQATIWAKAGGGQNPTLRRGEPRMQVRDVENADLNGVFHLLSLNGWAHRVHDVECLQRLVSASQRSCIAVDGGKVVGFARAITDGLSNGYLSMVVVAETHRRQGIGKALVKRIVDSDPRITWVLRAERHGAREFFASLGFGTSSDAMERLRH